MKLFIYFCFNSHCSKLSSDEPGLVSPFLFLFVLFYVGLYIVLITAKLVNRKLTDTIVKCDSFGPSLIGKIFTVEYVVFNRAFTIFLKLLM